MRYILIVFFLYVTIGDSWGLPALENGRPLVYKSEALCEKAAALLKIRLYNDYRGMHKPKIVVICPPEVEWYKFDKDREYADG